MQAQLDRLRRLSRSSRFVYIMLMVGLAAAALYAVFSTRIGQTALLFCCGGVLVLVVVGLASERGMRG